MVLEARPEARIDPLLDKVRDFWHMHPDLRFCQLVVVVSGMTDPFYMEDGQFAQKLTEMLEKSDK